METTKRQSGKPGWRFVFLTLGLAFLLSGLVRSLWLDTYYIPSGSMEPLLHTGDRIIVSRTDFSSEPIRRGDIVVFDGRGSFAPLKTGAGDFADAVSAIGRWLGLAGSDTTYVKRVIGLPGDEIQCCGPDGRLTVNGQPLDEPYVHPADVPSLQDFSVVVPANRLWLMGDHRAESADSRSLLGAPGGGMVSVDRVIGRPVQIIWPLDRFASVPRPAADGTTAKDGQ